MTIFSLFSANFHPHYHTILAINCPCIKLVHSSATNTINRWSKCSYCEMTNGDSKKKQCGGIPYPKMETVVSHLKQCIKYIQIPSDIYHSDKDYITYLFQHRFSSYILSARHLFIMTVIMVVGK